MTKIRIPKKILIRVHILIINCVVSAHVQRGIPAHGIQGLHVQNVQTVDMKTGNVNVQITMNVIVTKTANVIAMKSVHVIVIRIVRAIVKSIVWDLPMADAHLQVTLAMVAAGLLRPVIRGIVIHLVAVGTVSPTVAVGTVAPLVAAGPWLIHNAIHGHWFRNVMRIAPRHHVHVH